MKGNEEALAIAGDCRRGLRTLRVFPFRDVALMDHGFPHLAPALAVVTDHRLDLGVLVAGRQKNLVADDDGRTMPASRDRRLPDDVLGLAPVKRGCLSGGRHAVMARP